MAKYDFVGEIMEYEGGNMSVRRMLKLFSYLIRTGQAWTLQGSYGRQASRLIEAGYIDKKGKIQWKKLKDAGIATNEDIYNE